VVGVRLRAVGRQGERDDTASEGGAQARNGKAAGKRASWRASVNRGWEAFPFPEKNRVGLGGFGVRPGRERGSGAHRTGTAGQVHGTEKKAWRGRVLFFSFRRRARRWSLGAAGPSPARLGAAIGRAGGDRRIRTRTRRRLARDVCWQCCLACRRRRGGVGVVGRCSYWAHLTPLTQWVAEEAVAAVPVPCVASWVRTTF